MGPDSHPETMCGTDNGNDFLEYSPPLNITHTLHNQQDHILRTGIAHTCISMVTYY